MGNQQYKPRKALSSFWMYSMAYDTALLPFNLQDLVIPATHHSAVSSLRQLSVVSPYAVCQSLSVYNQLRAGVRFLYFDICDNYSWEQGKIMVSHTFVSCELQEPLEEVRRFLKDQQNEIVILYFKMDFERYFQSMGKLIDMLQGLFTEFPFVPKEQFKQPVKKLMQANYRLVIAGFQFPMQFEKLPAKEKQFFQKYVINVSGSWYYTNSGDPQEVYDKNVSYIKMGQTLRQNTLNMHQFIVTLNAEAIVKLGTIRSQTKVLKQLVQRSTESLEKCNVMLVDHFDDDDFELIHRLNLKRLQR